MNAIAMTFPKDNAPAGVSVDGSLAAIGALNDQSVTAVPLKPSASMLAAGSRAGGVSVEIAWKIYQAMIRHAG
ncbi:hypothetical protein [Azospirillum thermophilum]|nr:hypothetical protein [Azospirillum thermophilum]